MHVHERMCAWEVGLIKPKHTAVQTVLSTSDSGHAAVAVAAVVLRAAHCAVARLGQGQRAGTWTAMMWAGWRSEASLARMVETAEFMAARTCG